MANMQRRGFLGMLAGATLAGPKLASEIASQPIGVNPTAYGISNALATSAHGDWKAQRVAELRDLLAGGKGSEEAHERRMRRLYQAENIERFRLDSLRSVSATMKARMLAESNAEREQRIRRLNAENELQRLLSGDFG